jgi:hypothetical protein
MPGVPRRVQPPRRRPASAILAAIALAIAASVTTSGCLLFNNQNCSAGPAADVSWSISSSTGADLSCDDAGASTVNVYFGGVKQSFPCAANGGTTHKLPAAGSYSARAELVTANGTVLTDVPAFSVDIASCAATAVAPFAFTLSDTCASPPVVQLSWSILDSTATPIDCAGAGATSVVVTLGSMSFTFPCAQNAGMTDPVQPGSYDETVTLVDATGAVVAQDDPMTAVVACGAPLSRQVQFIVYK